MGDGAGDAVGAGSGVDERTATGVADGDGVGGDAAHAARISASRAIDLQNGLIARQDSRSDPIGQGAVRGARKTRRGLWPLQSVLDQRCNTPRRRAIRSSTMARISATASCTAARPSLRLSSFGMISQRAR